MINNMLKKKVIETYILKSKSKKNTTIIHICIDDIHLDIHEFAVQQKKGRKKKVKKRRDK